MGDWGSEEVEEYDGINNERTSKSNLIDEEREGDVSVNGVDESSRLMDQEEMHGDYVPDYILAEMEEMPNTGEHTVQPRRIWQQGTPALETPSEATRRRRSCSAETLIFQPGNRPTTSNNITAYTVNTEEGGRERKLEEERKGMAGGQKDLHKKVNPASLTRMIVEGLDNKLKESLRPIEIQCGELIQGLGMIGKDVVQLTTDIKLQKIRTDSVLSNLTPQGSTSKKQGGDKQRKMLQPKLWELAGGATATINMHTTTGASAANTSTSNMLNGSEDSQRGKGKIARTGQSEESIAASKLETQNGMLRNLLHRATSLGKNRKAQVAQLQSQMATSTGRKDKGNEKGRAGQRYSK